MASFCLRFDRHSCYFAKPDSPQAPIARGTTDLIQLLGEDISSQYGNRFDVGSNIDPYSYGFNQGLVLTMFNHLEFYLRLRAQEGCTKVEISSIIVHHNDYIMGLQVVYKQSYLDGNVTTTYAPRLLYNWGYYAHTGGMQQTSQIDFGDGEYLAQIRTRQGEVTDQITFVTNLRTVSFGGSGGSGEDLPVDLSRRVVAFVGTSNGVLERVGAVSIPRNWEAVGHLILLRALVEKRRATKIQKRRSSRILGAKSFAREEAMVQTFIMDSTEDIFKRTLSFLLPE